MVITGRGWFCSSAPPSSASRLFATLGKDGGAGNFGFEHGVLQDGDGIPRVFGRPEAAEPVVEQFLARFGILAGLGGAGFAARAAGLRGRLPADAFRDNINEHAAQDAGGVGIADPHGVSRRKRFQHGEAFLFNNPGHKLRRVPGSVAGDRVHHRGDLQRGDGQRALAEGEHRKLAAV